MLSKASSPRGATWPLKVQPLVLHDPGTQGPEVEKSWLCPGAASEPPRGLCASPCCQRLTHSSRWNRISLTTSTALCVAGANIWLACDWRTGSHRQGAQLSAKDSLPAGIKGVRSPPAPSVDYFRQLLSPLQEPSFASWRLPFFLFHSPVAFLLQD